jgi:hypothetical protein
MLALYWPELFEAGEGALAKGWSSQHGRGTGSGGFQKTHMEVDDPDWWKAGS